MSLIYFYQTCWRNNYAARPTAFTEMCVAEFSMWYEFKTSKDEDDASDSDITQI